MDFITSSYLEKTLDPLERVYRIWFSVFSLRLWRFWMSCDKTYALGVNFVTLNSYLCAEINAHALINLLVLLHDKPHLFKPWLFSSQPCECLFRTLRSFSSMNSTQVNFTLKDLFCRCKRVDACIRLTAQGIEDGIEYPR